MINKPRFWLAFKALAQIRDKMTTELMSRFYAYNAYYYGFYDQDFVLNSVLSGIPDAESIYTDSVFGLDSSSKIYLWVEALILGTDSSAYSLI